MDKLIYGLCALTAAWCSVLLLRAYARTHFRLLLWSGLCFAGLTLNNVLLVLDRLVFVDTDLSVARQLTALLSIGVMIAGLILEPDR